MTEPLNTPLERQLQENLNQIEQNLDSELSRRLYQARRAAIAQAGTPAPRFKYFKPALAASAASLLAVAMLISSPQTPMEDIITNGAKDAELISSQEDLELYQDLEFYSWLAVADHG